MSSSSGSPSSSGPFQRRGLISCLHSLTCRDEDAPLLHDQDMRQAMYRLIVGFYDQAYHRLRLPCKAMPDLFGLLGTAGLCLGLLYPVSNIILNTLALLPKDAAFHFAANGAAATNRSKKRRSRPGFDPWHEVAIRSYHALTEFLMAYFGCLTEGQAVRYLYRADANLPFAVMLVHHDLYLYHADQEAALIDPESDRTQAALKYAATAVGHPEPDTLARVMAIRLKHDDLVKMQLFSATAGAPLTAEDVRAIHRVLHTMMAPMCVANISHTNSGGLAVHVRQNLVDAIRWSETKPLVSTTSDGGARTTSTAFRWDGTPNSSSSVQQLGPPLLSNKLRDCLRTADAQKHILKCSRRDDARCDYRRSLRMCLHGMIHGFYITALKLLPTPSGSLMRSVLMAGHCYGSMDPVSNIVVNSVWYNGSHGRPLPESDRANIEQYNDILDPLSLLRLQVRSLKGLTELAAFADPRLSVATCALENLCSAKCDIVTMLLPSSSSSSSSTQRSEKKNPFYEASRAAGHPLPLQLGELHQQLLLRPVERNKLLSLITEAQTGGTVLPVDDIASVLDMVLFSSTAPAPAIRVLQAPELCVEALSVVSTSRSTYEGRRSWFRSKIEQALKDYTDRHFWGEPNYKLDFIIGVEERNKGRRPFYDTCYHVDFMATCDPKLQRTLFYAEFWSYSKKPKPEFCCPLPYAYPVGRCYYGVDTARKMVYPDDAKYIPDDITQDGTGSVDGMLEMDLVYFSSELDVELAENLNMLPNEDSDCDSSISVPRGRG